MLQLNLFSKMYCCPKCLKTFPDYEWNEKTKGGVRGYSFTTITPIEKATNRNYYFCPGCGIFINYPEIIQVY